MTGRIGGSTAPGLRTLAEGLAEAARKAGVECPDDQAWNARGLVRSLPPEGSVVAGLGLRENERWTILVAGFGVGDLETVGKPLGRVADRSFVAFDDVLVACWETEGNLAIVGIKAAAPGDEGLDPAALAALAGDRLLDEEEMAGRASDGDRRDIALFEAMASDAMEALVVGNGDSSRLVQWEAPARVGDGPSLRFVGWRGGPDATTRAVVEKAASFLSGDPLWGADTGGSPWLESGWAREAPLGSVPNMARAKSAALGAARREGARRRTIAWLTAEGCDEALLRDVVLAYGGEATGEETVAVEPHQG